MNKFDIIGQVMYMTIQMTILFFGLVLGGLVSLILWPIVGLGWWTFAVPIGTAVIGSLLFNVTSH